MPQHWGVLDLRTPKAIGIGIFREYRYVTASYALCNECLVLMKAGFTAASLGNRDEDQVLRKAIEALRSKFCQAFGKIIREVRKRNTERASVDLWQIERIAEEALEQLLLDDPRDREG